MPEQLLEICGDSPAFHGRPGFNLESLYNQLLWGLYGINGIVISVVYKMGFFDKFEH